MYNPSRSSRYHYLWDLMHDIEDNQCRTCVFSKLVTDPGLHADEFPMCWKIEGTLSLEEPVEVLDELPDGVVVCRQYRNVDRALEARGQGSLFDEGLGSTSL